MKRVLLSSICLLGVSDVCANNGLETRPEALIRMINQWQELSVNVISQQRAQQLPALFEKHKNTIFAELKTLLLYTREHSEQFKLAKGALVNIVQAVKEYPVLSRSATIDDFIKHDAIAPLISNAMALSVAGDEARRDLLEKYDLPFVKEYYADMPSSVETMRAIGALLSNPANQVLFMQGPLTPAEAAVWQMAVKGADLGLAVSDDVFALFRDNIDTICAQLDVLHALPDKSMDNAEFMHQLVVFSLISCDICAKCIKPAVDRIVKEQLFGIDALVNERFTKMEKLFPEALALVRSDEWFSATWQKTHNFQEIIVTVFNKLRPEGSTCANACGCCRCTDTLCCPECAEHCGSACANQAVCCTGDVDKSSALDENKI